MNSDKRIKTKSPLKRHRIIWTVLRAFIRPVVRVMYRFSCEKLPVGKEPCLVLVNHTVNMDPLLVAAASKRQMYFVASDHVYRYGFWSKALKWLVAPIPRTKGGSALSTVLAVKRAFAGGASVCIFAEGNRTWDGITGPFPAGTASLARSGGVWLVNAVIEGGYLTQPRWATTIRKGGARLVVRGKYSPEELGAMTDGEVNELISRDLYENAFERNVSEKRVYKGKNRAEFLESLLFICPRCGQMSGLVSREHTLRCTKCESVWEFGTDGLLTGGYFSSLVDWNAWQKAELFKRLDAGGVLTDEEGEVFEIVDGEEHLRDKGEVRLSAESFSVGHETFPINSITGFSIFLKNTIAFSADRKSYVVKFPSKRFNALKYEYSVLHLSSRVKV